MSDLEFLHAHLPEFPEYGDEHDRNGSDQRVRAFVGMALTEAQERLTADIDPETRTKLDAMMFKSQFSDNKYLKKLGHAHLDDEHLASMAREDRKLVEIATRLGGTDAAGLGAILSEIEAQYEARHVPLPAP